jgi:hypothetical protein
VTFSSSVERRGRTSSDQVAVPVVGSPFSGGIFLKSFNPSGVQMAVAAVAAVAISFGAKTLQEALMSSFLLPPDCPYLQTQLESDLARDL